MQREAAPASGSPEKPHRTGSGACPPQGTCGAAAENQGEAGGRCLWAPGGLPEGAVGTLQGTRARGRQQGLAVASALRTLAHSPAVRA